MKIYYIYGSAWCGKTSYVFQKHGYDDVYRTTNYEFGQIYCFLKSSEVRSKSRRYWTIWTDSRLEYAGGTITVWLAMIPCISFLTSH